MGCLSSWVAIQAPDKAGLFEALEVEDGERSLYPGEGNRDTWCYGSLPGGWLVVFTNVFEYFTPEKVVELSRFGAAVGGQFEDKFENYDVVVGAENGGEIWRAFHTLDIEPLHLEVSGQLPEGWEAVRDEALRQTEQDGDDSPDYMHDVPLDIARLVCGFRHDEQKEPFKELMWRGKLPRPERPPSLLGKLFGFGRR